MSFDNDYPNRKDWRGSYYNSESFDRSCRHGGRCAWCIHNRLYHRYRTELESLAELRAYRRGFYTVPIYDPVDENEAQLFSYNAL